MPCGFWGSSSGHQVASGLTFTNLASHLLQSITGSWGQDGHGRWLTKPCGQRLRLSTTILSYPAVLEHFFGRELTSLYILTHVYIYLTDRKYTHSFHTVSVIFIGVSWNKYYLYLILFLIEFLCQLGLKLGCLDRNSIQMCCVIMLDRALVSRITSPGRWRWKWAASSPLCP